MTRPTTIVLDGKRHLWADILRLRQEQCVAATHARQLLLFNLVDDSRPVKQRTATGRYVEPSLWTLLEEKKQGASH